MKSGTAVGLFCVACGVSVAAPWALRVSKADPVRTAWPRNSWVRKASDPPSRDELPAPVNSQAAAAAANVRERGHPERVAPLVAPAPFNRARFERDPDSYLNVTEPGRVFQTARAGRGVPVLASVTSIGTRVPPGGSVELGVRAAPLAPVSFTIFDQGIFDETRLPTATVRAGNDGLAQVRYVATRGAMSTVNILAGSPLASGRVRFRVDVRQ